MNLSQLYSIPLMASSSIAYNLKPTWLASHKNLEQLMNATSGEQGALRNIATKSSQFINQALFIFDVRFDRANGIGGLDGEWFLDDANVWQHRYISAIETTTGTRPYKYIRSVKVYYQGEDISMLKKKQLKPESKKAIARNVNSVQWLSCSCQS